MTSLKNWLAGSDRTVIHLQMARSLRSISQGIAVVDLALYLKDLHWSATAIGGVLSAAGLVGAALIMFVGLMSDRLGRKPFLLCYEVMTAVAAVLLTLSANPVLLTVVIIFTGFGRGQNGAAGPFTPAEQAWMAAHVRREHQGRIFSTNNALGFFGMATGSMLAGMSHLWIQVLPGAMRYRPLFGLMALMSMICVLVIWTIPAERVTVLPNRGGNSDEAREARNVWRQENRSMAKLAIVNLLNGLAIGFTGPLMSYWFAVRFGVSSADIGVTLAVSFVVTGISSLLTGSLSQRYGVVRSVVWLQAASVILTLALPLFASFELASLAFILRSALSRGTQGVRSVVSTRLTRNERRGFSVSMNSLAMRTTSAVGPTMAGQMLQNGDFGLPFYITGVLQLASALIYGRLFHRYDGPSSETSSAV